MEKATKINLRINLGCGDDYKEGWINIDNNPKVKADVHASIDNYNLEGYTVDEILLSHVAMYIRPEEMEVLLKKWYTWLIKGGKITIETINLETVMDCAMNFDENLNKSWGLDNIFGPKEAQHRWGWTISELYKELKKAGFDEIQCKKGLKKPNRDYLLTAIK